MKQLFLFLFIVLASSLRVYSQEKNQPDTFRFTVIKELPVTPVKDQSNSSTCWSFSGIGMIEAELLRMGKGSYDLSEMFIVHKNYQDKAEKYVRMHGSTGFSAGGSFADVLEAVRDYGIVPESVMSGLNYGENKHYHSELDALTESYVKTMIGNPNKKLSTAWYPGFNGILDAYLGKCPDTFIYEGKEYTPSGFSEFLGIDTDNYLSITSFTHHPFYEAFPVEVPDNWRWALSYNLPISEMIGVINGALEQGYTIAWASDVSEKSFSRKGIAVVPDPEAETGPGSDEARWLGLSKKEKESRISTLKGPVPELNVSQEMRQQAFDNYETTDDHGMLIYGMAKDQFGTPYYLVKNSWGTDSPFKGTWYVSETFVKYKTLSIVVNKNALSKDLKKKLKLQ